MKTKLLTQEGSNPKAAKSAKFGWSTAVLHLAPSTVSGHQVCPAAELAKCTDPCLNIAGHAAMAKGNETMIAPGGQAVPANAAQAARIRRTKLLFEEPSVFWPKLVREIRNHIRRAHKHGLKPCVRLNATSDIRWELMRWQGKTMMEHFPEAKFYDYSKLKNRRVPDSLNYHLTLSYSEASAKYAQEIREAADAQGRNLAVVFRKHLPSSFLGRPVINGDEHDLRFLDPVGVVVGLKAKGRAKRDRSGFVID